MIPKSGKFMKKPVVIEAIQWTGENLFEVITFTDGKPDLNSDIAMERWEQYENLVKRDGLLIYALESGPNHEAKHFASIGDYIVKGVQGEHYPVKPDIFLLTYTPV
jgi:hypothetical protein